jgi:hypothetical protein
MFDLSKYETVDERLHRLRDHYPTCRIVTREVECNYEKGWVRFITEIYVDVNDAFPIVTGHADGFRKDRGVDKDFWYNNAETSSIGRAIANFAMSKVGARPSREEMESVARAENDKAAVQSVVGIMNDNDWDSFVGKPKDEDNVISLADAVDLVQSTLGGSTIESTPMCAHGAMLPKSGVSKKTNKPYSGFVCMNFGDQCPPIWSK